MAKECGEGMEKYLRALKPLRTSAFNRITITRHREERRADVRRSPVISEAKNRRSMEMEWRQLSQKGTFLRHLGQIHPGQAVAGCPG